MICLLIFLTIVNCQQWKVIRSRQPNTKPKRPLHSQHLLQRLSLSFRNRKATLLVVSHNRHLKRKARRENLCTEISCDVTYYLLSRNLVQDEIWRFILTGGVALENPHPNPSPEWLTDKAWGEIVRASDLPGFKGLMTGILVIVCAWT